MAQDIMTEVIIKGDISYLNSGIERKQIEGFTKYDLRILKNTIFAKYNYEFYSKDLKEHFSRFPWYNGKKTNVQGELTKTDWVNIALIQSLEKTAEEGIPNIGNHLSLSGKIYTLSFDQALNFDQEILEKVSINGEITVYASALWMPEPEFNDRNRIEIARARVIDNEFVLSLNEISPDMLWDKKKMQKVGVHHEELRPIDMIWLQQSDPEAKFALIKFEMTGTFIDWNNKKRSFHDELFERITGYEDYFFYIYSDRDVIIRGVNKDKYDDFNHFRNLSLKKGWNKVRHHIVYIGKNNYYHLLETTQEKGNYKLYFDTTQGTTLRGKIITEERHYPSLGINYYLVLNQPIIGEFRRGKRIIDTQEIYKVLLHFNENIYKTIPEPGNYELYGDWIGIGFPLFSVINFSMDIN